MTLNVAETLQEFINAPIDPVLFPVKSGNKINIGSYSIRNSAGVYTIKSYKADKIIARTYTKTAAVAVAKSLSKGNTIHKILELDEIAAKHRNDCMFYKHTLKKTTNPIKWETTWMRYDISKQTEQDAISKIKKFIF